MVKTLKKKKTKNLLSVVLLDEQFQNEMASGKLTGSESLIHGGGIKEIGSFLYRLTSKHWSGEKM